MRELSKIRRHMKARTRSGEASERSFLVDFNRAYNAHHPIGQ